MFNLKNNFSCGSAFNVHQFEGHLILVLQKNYLTVALEAVVLKTVCAIMQLLKIAKERRVTDF